MPKQILIVDDEPHILHVLEAYLKKAGFEVLVARDGDQALAFFHRQKPQLIVLDLTLPDMDGLDVARLVRSQSNVPIIMLTARVEETDRLIGLELGADDYVTKPFSPREIVARVRAVLRRADPPGETPARLIQAAGIMLDTDKRQASVIGRPVELTQTEFDLLAALMEHPGRVLSRMQLLDKVQGFAYEGYDRTIDVHIKNLRQKIEEDPHKPRYILTVYGLGYKFTEEDNA